MPTPYWADYLVAFRRRERLTQSQLAAKLGVKSPTVSRWEAGVHIPDLASQKALKALLGALDSNTEAEWVFRVGAAHGVSYLFSRDRGLIASSRGGAAAVDLKAFCAAAFCDRSFDLETGVAGPQPAQVQARLFDGSIRFLHFAFDTPGDVAPSTFIVDVWPIITTEQSALIHVGAHPRSAPVRAPGGGVVKARDLTFVAS